MKNKLNINYAAESHLVFADDVCLLIEESAKVRGTGIARRSPDYIRHKMQEGKAVIAFYGDTLAGFCYIESWGHDRFVANSGLIVHPELRGMGIAKLVKAKAFELSRKKFPDAKIFGLTTSLPVMKINSDLGYKPVTFSELTDDEAFWKGCESCVNYDILQRTGRKQCLCTGMLFDPKKEEIYTNARFKPFKVYERWLRFKQHILFKRVKNRIKSKKKPSKQWA